MGLTLAVDFGSTYTKLAAFDLDRNELVGIAQAKSTVDTDITIGLMASIEKLRLTLDKKRWEIDKILACSSAAGGLRIVALGLVKVLTTKAAEEAALGAGAKVVGTYSFGITAEDVVEIEEKKPDLILLTGGTDGGNKEVLIENAKLLATSRLDVPILIAGNRVGAKVAYSILMEAGKYSVVEENVLPELGRLNVDPTRAMVRDIFMRRITHAKGLDKAKTIVGDIIMPTPMAVLKGTALLADGVPQKSGLGELIIVDIGGATIDIHSVAHGLPIEPDITVKGLPEPYQKRTVEGDLGIRHNTQTILEKVGPDRIRQKMALLNKALSQHIHLEKKVEYLSHHIDVVPNNEEDLLVDFGLASSALEVAIHRHAGIIKEFQLTCGKSRIQYGKDLRDIKTVIGTGGIFAHGNHPYWILKSTIYNKKDPESLRPLNPQFFIDTKYILYAIGLLAELAPEAALKIMMQHLKMLKDETEKE